MTERLRPRKPPRFPEGIVDARGKQRKRYAYEQMVTPCDKLKSLPKAEHFLKPEVTFEHLNALAMQVSTFSGWQAGS